MPEKPYFGQRPPEKPIPERSGVPKHRTLAGVLYKKQQQSESAMRTEHQKWRQSLLKKQKQWRGRGAKTAWDSASVAEAAEALKK
jgi:hypothetical protein